MECRICCLSENQEDLVSPCKCSGTMKFVHRKCLNHWRRICTNPKNITHCDLCEEPYFIYLTNRQIQLKFKDIVINMNIQRYSTLMAVISTLKKFSQGIAGISLFSYLWGSISTGTIVPSYNLMLNGMLGTGISFFSLNVLCLLYLISSKFEHQNTQQRNNENLIIKLLLGRETNFWDYITNTRPTTGFDIILQLISQEKQEKQKQEKQEKEKKKEKNSSENSQNYLFAASLGLISLSCVSSYYLYNNYKTVKQRYLINDDDLSGDDL